MWLRTWSLPMFFFFSSRRRHTRCGRDWSSDVCSSDLRQEDEAAVLEQSRVRGDEGLVVGAREPPEVRPDLLRDLAEGDREAREDRAPRERAAGGERRVEPTVHEDEPRTPRRRRVG